jgi:3-phytase/alkaline phosphatase D
LTALLAALGAAAEGPREVQLLGELRLPAGTRFVDATHGETVVGGLSALHFDPASGVYRALSDGPDTGGPARFYTLTLDLADGRLSEGDLQILAMTPLTAEDGGAFAKDQLDPEGLALTPAGTLLLSSEGSTRDGIPPLVAEVGQDGRFRHRLPLPPAYRPRRPRWLFPRGTRQNLALEALTVTPSGCHAWTGTENALAQDGPRATVRAGSPSRLLRYDLVHGQPDLELIYVTDPVVRPPREPDGPAVAGLVELLAEGDDRLLALERSFSAGVGYSIKLYRVELSGAAPITGRRRLPRREAARRPVTKTLLLDLSDLGIELDNLEGMTWGPPLPDGRRTLVLLSDDNFHDDQVTQFLLLALPPS